MRLKKRGLLGATPTKKHKVRKGDRPEEKGKKGGAFLGDLTADRPGKETRVPSAKRREDKEDVRE